MNEKQAKDFREKIRILERKLGLLKKNNGSINKNTLTLPQCHSLIEIGRAEKISLKNLSKILSIDISTTSRTVESLVKKEYVIRTTSSEDRRSVDIYLSESGKLLFNEIESEMDNYFSEIFSRIPQNEKGNVLIALDTILKAFNN